MCTLIAKFIDVMQILLEIDRLSGNLCLTKTLSRCSANHVFSLYLLATQEGHEGLVQAAPENSKEKRRRIWWQSQKEGQFSNQY